jgi:hypothetical protein
MAIAAAAAVGGFGDELGFGEGPGAAVAGTGVCASAGPASNTEAATPETAPKNERRSAISLG